MASLLTLILGLLIGFWGWTIYAKINEVLARLRDKRMYEEAGIVRPKAQTMERVDLTSPSGGVRRPTPDEYLIANMKERDAKLKKVS